MSWAALSEKAHVSPFIPDPDAENFDKRHIMKEEDTSDEDPLILRRNSIQQLFEGYEYDNSLPIRKDLSQQRDSWTEEKIKEHSTSASTNSRVVT